MIGPRVTPEDGVGRYEDDRTQGPACAVTAGAATIYRNYFAPVGDDVGQTANRQLDGLKSLGIALSAALGTPVAVNDTFYNWFRFTTARLQFYLFYEDYDACRYRDERAIQ